METDDDAMYAATMACEDDVNLMQAEVAFSTQTRLRDVDRDEAFAEFAECMVHEGVVVTEADDLAAVLAKSQAGLASGTTTTGSPCASTATHRGSTASPTGRRGSAHRRHRTRSWTRGPLLTPCPLQSSRAVAGGRSAARGSSRVARHRGRRLSLVSHRLAGVRHREPSRSWSS